MSMMCLPLVTGAQAGWPLIREAESHVLPSRLPAVPMRDEGSPVLYNLRIYQGPRGPGFAGRGCGREPRVQEHNLSLSSSLSLLSSFSARVVATTKAPAPLLPACSESAALLWICDQAHSLPDTSFLPCQSREVSRLVA